MISIPLGNGRGVALVDDCDAALAEFRWSLHSMGYAARGIRTGVDRWKWVKMHRVILGVEDPKIHVDHINRDKLDNRRANLRTCTNEQNAQNIPAQGVWRGAHRLGNRWTASGQGRSLGTFASEIEAARVAEAYRLAHMPFAVPDARLLELDPCICPDCDPGRDRRTTYERKLDQLVALWAQGLPVAQIAAELGLKANSMQAEIVRQRRLGADLPLRRSLSSQSRSRMAESGRAAAARLHAYPETEVAA